LIRNRNQKGRFTGCRPKTDQRNRKIHWKKNPSTPAGHSSSRKLRDESSRSGPGLPLVRIFSRYKQRSGRRIFDILFKGIRAIFLKAASDREDQRPKAGAWLDNSNSKPGAGDTGQWFESGQCSGFRIRKFLSAGIQWHSVSKSPGDGGPERWCREKTHRCCQTSISPSGFSGLGWLAAPIFQFPGKPLWLSAKFQ